jgi:hypothetical protein
MGLLSWFRNLRSPTPPTAVVTFDESGVQCRRSVGLVESVRWSDLQAVFIQTTDDGPLVDDVFWILAGSDSGCVVPSEASGVSALIDRLQQLPGFDNEAVVKAMASPDNKQFVCWRRSQDAAADGGGV